MKILIIVSLVLCVVAAIVFLVRTRSDAPSANLAHYSENQSWIVHRGGDVVKKKEQSGVPGLNDWERLVYCLWVTDYMMRNAGDFANADVLYPDFQTDAKRYAEQLNLPITREAFSLSRRKLQKEYVSRFEAICNEIKSAEPKAPNGSP